MCESCEELEEKSLCEDWGFEGLPYASLSVSALTMCRGVKILLLPF